MLKEHRASAPGYTPAPPPAPKRYIVLKDRFIAGEKAADTGNIVFQHVRCDFGLAEDDTRCTAIEHISVTHDPNGGYPFFTIPAADVEEVS